MPMDKIDVKPPDKSSYDDVNKNLSLMNTGSAATCVQDLANYNDVTVTPGSEYISGATSHVPDPPTYNDVTVTPGAGYTSGTTTRPTIFTVEGSQSGQSNAKANGQAKAKATKVSKGSRGVKSTGVKSLKFRTYEFPEVNKHFVPTKRNGPRFPPEKVHLALCLFNIPFMLGYLICKGESLEAYREGKVQVSKNYCVGAYCFMIFAVLTPFIIASIIILATQLSQ